MANGRKPVVLPAGMNSQTMAVQALVRKKRPQRKKKKKTAKKKTRARAQGVGARKAPQRRTAKKKTGRLVKGSPAAKRRMAQLRKMRGKK